MSHGGGRALEPAEAAYVRQYVEDFNTPDHAESRRRGRDVLRRELAALEAVQSFGAFSVLDAGCGDGHFSLAARSAGLSTTLLDVDRTITGEANDLLARRGFTPSPTINGLIEHLSPDHGRWDAAVCMEVVEHVPRPAAVVRALAARVRRVVVLTTPVGRAYWDPGHVHIFEDEAQLSDALALDANFRRVHIERIPSRDGDTDRVFFVVGEV